VPPNRSEPDPSRPPAGRRSAPRDRTLACAGTWLLGLAFAAGTAGAAIPVEEAIPPGSQEGTGTAGRPAGTASGGLGRPTLAPPPVDDPAPGAGADVGVVLYELQLLQEEVQQLRGLVEEQEYRLERMEAEQQSRYLEIDQRLRALGAGSGPAPQGGPTGGAGTGTGTGSGADGTAAVVSPAGTEQAAYQQAYGLLQDRRFDDAIQAFEAFLDAYPSGQYAGNAMYWLGELHLVSEPPDLEQARQSLVQVLRLFPDHRKVPDALYKLGVIYRALGEAPQARAYLEQVLAEHPDATVARKAASLLRELDSGGTG
jgi:tol-pal system protein YbgF